MIIITNENGQIEQIQTVDLTNEVRQKYLDIGKTITLLDPVLTKIVDGQIINLQSLNLAPSKNPITADGIDLATITGIPVGARVIVIHDNDIAIDEIVTDGELSFSAQAPDLYRVIIKASGYLDQTIEVNAI